MNFNGGEMKGYRRSGDMFGSIMGRREIFNDFIFGSWEGEFLMGFILCWFSPIPSKFLQNGGGAK